MASEAPALVTMPVSTTTAVLGSHVGATHFTSNVCGSGNQRLTRVVAEGSRPATPRTSEPVRGAAAGPAMCAMVPPAESGAAIETTPIVPPSRSAQHRHMVRRQSRLVGSGCASQFRGLLDLLLTLTARTRTDGVCQIKGANLGLPDDLRKLDRAEVSRIDTNVELARKRFELSMAVAVKVDRASTHVAPRSKRVVAEHQRRSIDGDFRYGCTLCQPSQVVTVASSLLPVMRCFWPCNTLSRAATRSGDWRTEKSPRCKSSSLIPTTAFQRSIITRSISSIDVNGRR